MPTLPELPGLPILPPETELTIASGAITVPGPGRFLVDTEADASADDLETINGGIDGMVIWLGRAGSGRAVTYKTTGNLVGINGAMTEWRDSSQGWVKLMYRGATSKWHMLDANVISSNATTVDNTAARWNGTGGFTIEESGVKIDDDDNVTAHGYSLAAETELTISSGAITVPGPGRYLVDTEADAATDDLVTINGGADGMQIKLFRADVTRAALLKITGNIVGMNSNTFEFYIPNTGCLQFLYRSSDSKWHQVAGNVVGTATTVDNSLVRWNGTGGFIVDDCGVTIDDNDCLTVKSVQQTHTTEADGATVTFDLNDGNSFQTTITDDRTLAISNGKADQVFTIDIIQGTGGSHTVTWFATVHWPGGTVPTLSTAEGAVDKFIFVKKTSTYQGFTLGLDVKAAP